MDVDGYHCLQVIHPPTHITPLNRGTKLQIHLKTSKFVQSTVMKVSYFSGHIIARTLCLLTRVVDMIRCHAVML